MKWITSGLSTSGKSPQEAYFVRRLTRDCTMPKHPVQRRWHRSARPRKPRRDRPGRATRASRSDPNRSGCRTQLCSQGLLDPNPSPIVGAGSCRRSGRDGSGSRAEVQSHPIPTQLGSNAQGFRPGADRPSSRPAGRRHRRKRSGRYAPDHGIRPGDRDGLQPHPHGRPSSRAGRDRPGARPEPVGDDAGPLGPRT